MTINEETYNKYGRLFRKGEVIFREGDTGEKMYIIQSGKIRISKRTRDRETTLAVLSDGDFFGEMAIIDKEPRSATATAVEDSRVIILDDEVFETQIRANPKIVMQILRKMSSRLRDADRQIKTLTFRDSSSRVVGTLLLLVSRSGKSTERGICFDYGAVITELSNMVGLPTNKLIVTKAENLERFMNFLELKEEFGI
jgi:CRP/FNR family transcriptional regulator